MSDKNHYFYGKHHSEETKEKMSKAQFGKNNGMYNETHSQKSKKKISEANSGKKRSKETKEKMSKNKKKYYREHPKAKEKAKRSFIKASRKKSFSKISQKFFWKIYNELSKDLQEQTYFAELNHEHYMCGKYMVDFYIKSLDLIIEFFGDYWHANPDKYKKDDIVYGKVKASQVWKKDEQRIKDLKNKGYTVKIIWEKDLEKLKNIDKIMEFLNLKIKEEK